MTEEIYPPEEACDRFRRTIGHAVARLLKAAPREADPAAVTAVVLTHFLDAAFQLTTGMYGPQTEETFVKMVTHQAEFIARGEHIAKTPGQEGRA